VNTRDVCFVGPPVKPAGDTRAGDRLRRVLDGPRQAHGPRAPVCPGTSPRRGRPQSAAADSHARPAAWRERYRRGQHGDCSTKRDYGSPIRVTFSEVSNWPDVVCCARPETRLRVPTATGGRAAPVRLKRPAECPTSTAEVAMSGRRVIVGHRASRRWRTGPIHSDQPVFAIVGPALRGPAVRTRLWRRLTEVAATEGTSSTSAHGSRYSTHQIVWFTTVFARPQVDASDVA